jgi:hypothetical protein
MGRTLPLKSFHAGIFSTFTASDPGLNDSKVVQPGNLMSCHLIYVIYTFTVAGMFSTALTLRPQPRADRLFPRQPVFDRQTLPCLLMVKMRKVL